MTTIDELSQVLGRESAFFTVSGRETDAADLRNLASVATEDEWKLAGEAVTQIQNRGFARGRQLDAKLLSLRDQTR